MGRCEGAAVGAALLLAASILAMTPTSRLALLPAAGFLGAMAAWIAAVDSRYLTIPDGPTLAIGVIGMALRLAGRDAGPGIEATDIALIVPDAVLWSGGLLAMREIYFRWRGLDGIGLGDVKLAAACGVLNGSEGFAWAMLAASGTALLAVWAAGRLAARPHEDRVPFGAFLAPACCGIWIVQAVGWV